MGKEYQAKFEHDTTVEGDDALEAMRGRLLNLYMPMSVTTEETAAAATAPETPGSYAPPPPGAAAEVMEPSVDVPEQFKQIFRRARKQLLKQADVDLLQAFNGFVSALNEGRSDNDLIELGDDLADAFDDARDRAR
jgi:hypothetical protein